jgi:prepilin-type processing-associated H-X9-DG protein
VDNQPPPIPPLIPQPALKTSRWAIASLILGMLAITCIVPTLGGILAISFGVLALKQISQSSGTIKGHEQAIAGIVLGCFGLIIASTILPALNTPSEKARRMACMNNLAQIGKAISLYSAEHDGLIPTELNDLRPYVGSLDKLLICPSTKDRSRPSYQILLGGKKWNSPETIDAIVISESLANHRGGRNALYGDGHVEFRIEQQDNSSSH